MTRTSLKSVKQGSTHCCFFGPNAILWRFSSSDGTLTYSLLCTFILFCAGIRKLTYTSGSACSRTPRRNAARRHLDNRSQYPTAKVARVDRHYFCFACMRVGFVVFRRKTDRYHHCATTGSPLLIDYDKRVAYS